MQIILDQEKVDAITRLQHVLNADDFGDVIQRNSAKRISDCYTYITKELHDGLTIMVFTSHGSNAELKVELSVRGKTEAAYDKINNIIYKANQLAEQHVQTGFEALIIDYIRPKNQRYWKAGEINKVIFQSPAGGVQNSVSALMI